MNKLVKRGEHGVAGHRIDPVLAGAMNQVEVILLEKINALMPKGRQANQVGLRIIGGSYIVGVMFNSGRTMRLQFDQSHIPERIMESDYDMIAKGVRDMATFKADQKQQNLIP